MNRLLKRGGASALALVGMAAGGAVPAEAAPKLRYEFGYFLPRTSFGAAAAERLIKCPTHDDPDAVIETTVVIDSTTRPDPDAYVRLDTSSGFLAKRSTEIKLNPDGTLAAFNGSTEGEGGAVLGAVIKVATTFASAAIAAPVVAAKPLVKSSEGKPSSACTAKVAAEVAHRDMLLKEVADLEAQIVAGQTSPAVAALLDRRRTALADAEDALTLTGKVVIDPDNVSKTATEVAASLKDPSIDPIAVAGWFEGGQVPANVACRPSSKGFRLAWTVDQRVVDALASSGEKGDVPKGLQSNLVYRRPIPVSVKVASVGNDDSDCARFHYGRLDATKIVHVAQLSPVFLIPLGRGGLFGSRQAEADFDANGVPTRLKYGSLSGDAGIATVVNAAGDGFTTLRGAAAAARDRQLQVLRDKKEYRDLMAALNETQ